MSSYTQGTIFAVALFGAAAVCLPHRADAQLTREDTLAVAELLARAVISEAVPWSDYAKDVVGLGPPESHENAWSPHLRSALRTMDTVTAVSTLLPYPRSLRIWRARAEADTLVFWVGFSQCKGGQGPLSLYEDAYEYVIAFGGGGWVQKTRRYLFHADGECPVRAESAPPPPN